MKNELKMGLALIGSFILSNPIVGQKAPVLIKFHDGRVMEGLGKLKNNEVKYWSQKKAKPQYFSFQELESFRIKQGAEWGRYRSIQVKNVEGPIMLELKLAGKVSLYQQSSHGYMPTGPGGVGSVGGTGFGGGQFYAINRYYLKKENEEAIHMGSNQLFEKSFKKAASEYFKNCPSLVEKLQKREYKKKHIEEVVAYYNNKCN
ncbi:hypothetical protein [Flagellimonas nanhaiensis]|uniref:Uncharacterized protein n=1 Tax=Flagellimonas nanhaiensis TaxID=2292706 RepID=A0A371JSJ4_9FLAO|nr:hypothetical protein [Allomuricauda nanhaiensis]RDY60775.1 hypothetical protein DX873_00925 [Allomuricauda nanhaiensis]